RDDLVTGVQTCALPICLEQRGVLIFRELGLTDEQHLAFTRTLGDLMLQGGDELLNISLDKDANKGKEYLADYLKGSWYWHIDQRSEERRVGKERRSQSG